MDAGDFPKFASVLFLVSLIVGVGVLVLDRMGGLADVVVSGSEVLTWPANGTNVSLAQSGVSGFSITNSSGDAVPADQYLLFASAGIVTNVYSCVDVDTEARPYIVAPNTSSGYNSDDYDGNYNLMAAQAVQSGFNTTRSFTVGGVTYLTVPEFSSSTACSVAQLVGAYNGTPQNMTKFEVRSDAFSEAGVVLAGSNLSGSFDAWYNTLAGMDQCGYGVLPCWVVEWNNTQINAYGGANDTAIDGSVRAGIALYIASDNDYFTVGNQSKYLSLANDIARDSYRYETISIAGSIGRSGLNVTRLPMGGGDCAGGGLGCSVDQWIGYTGDIIKFFEMAYNRTGNATYDLAARNFTAAVLSISLQKDNDGDGFGVAPFNFNWDVTGPLLNHTDGGGVNSYHYSAVNAQWEDSDAPRFSNFCDVLRYVNRTNRINGVYTNLSTYCAKWANSATLTNTTSCLQYYYNGTCATTIRTGYYENGLGTFISTYHNLTWTQPKVNEVLSHYGFNTGVFDGSSCGTALSFRGSKSAKSVMALIGADMFTEGSTAICSPAAACAVGASCTAAYTYTEADTAASEALTAGRVAVGEIATDWLSLIVLIGCVAVMLGMMIKGFSGGFER
jgi:hypothetical protein